MFRWWQKILQPAGKPGRNAGLEEPGVKIMEYVGIHEIFSLGLSLMDESGFEEAVEDFRHTTRRFGRVNRGSAVVEVELGEPLNLGDDKIFWTLMQYVTSRNWQNGLRDLLFGAEIEKAYLDRLNYAISGSGVEYLKLNTALKKAISRDYGKESGKLFRRAALIIDCRMYWDAKYKEKLLIEAAEVRFSDCTGTGLQGLQIEGKKVNSKICKAYDHCLKVQRSCLQAASARQEWDPALSTKLSGLLKEAWDAFCGIVRREYLAPPAQQEVLELALGKFCRDSELLLEKLHHSRSAGESSSAGHSPET